MATLRPGNGPGRGLATGRNGKEKVVMVASVCEGLLGLNLLYAAGRGKVGKGTEEERDCRT